MTNILKLQSLDGNTIKQGDKSPIEYELIDSNNNLPDIEGLDATVFLSNGFDIVYQAISVVNKRIITKELPDKSKVDETHYFVEFTIDEILNENTYYVEISVDERLLFPSDNTERLYVKASALGNGITNVLHNNLYTELIQYGLDNNLLDGLVIKAHDGKDGRDGRDGLNGQNGLNGINGDSITVIEHSYDENGNTLIKFSDNTIVTILHGKKGEDGKSISIESQSEDENGNVVVTMNDGSSFTVPKGKEAAPLTITGYSEDEDGNYWVVFSDNNSIMIPKGKDGEKGLDGQNGRDGSIVTINSDGFWTIDGTATTIKAGEINNTHTIADITDYETDVNSKLNALKTEIKGLIDAKKSGITEEELNSKLQEINNATTEWSNAFAQAVQDNTSALVETNKEYTDSAIAKLVDNAPDTLDTLNEIAESLKTNKDVSTSLLQQLGEKASTEEVTELLKGKSDVNHNHNDLYANKVHTHNTTEVLGLEGKLSELKSEIDTKIDTDTQTIKTNVDTVNGKVTTLEDNQNKLTTKLNGLEVLRQDNTENGVVVTFKNGSSITIPKGEKGDTGAQGIAGVSPSVKDYVESKDYTTVNMTDGTSFKVKNGRNGKNGDGGSPVVNDKDITYRATDFLRTGKNLFNSFTVIQNKKLNVQNGELEDSDEYVTTDFLPVKSGEEYVTNQSERVVFYDKDKEFISGLDEPEGLDFFKERTFTTPSNATFIRMNSLKQGVGTYNYKGVQLESGSTSTPFEPFNYYLDGISVKLKGNSVSGLNVEDHSIGIDKLDFVNSNLNLFNPDKIVYGKTVDSSTGELIDGDGLVTSDYITVEEKSYYSTNVIFQDYAFYDENFNLIYHPISADITIQAPPLSKYIRFSIPLSKSDSIVFSNTVQPIYKETPYHTYIPYKHLDSVEIEKLSENDYYGRFNMNNYVVNATKQLLDDDMFTDEIQKKKLEIAIVGSNNNEYLNVITKPLKKRLVKEFGVDGGMGFVGISEMVQNKEKSVPIEDRVKVEFDSSWKREYGDVDMDTGYSYYEMYGAAYSSRDTGSTLTLTFLEDIDKFELIIDGEGEYKYKIDSGEYEPTTHGSTVKKLDNLSKPVVTIEVVSGEIILHGVYGYKNETGVVVNTLGAQSTDYYSNSITSADIARIPRGSSPIPVEDTYENRFDAIGIIIGQKDAANYTSTSELLSDLRNIINRFKNFSNKPSVFLISPPTDASESYLDRNLRLYDKKMSELARELRIGYVSLYKTFDASKMQDLQNENLLDWSYGLTKLGGVIAANIIYDRLLRI